MHWPICRQVPMGESPWTDRRQILDPSGGWSFAEPVGFVAGRRFKAFLAPTGGPNCPSTRAYPIECTSLMGQHPLLFGGRRAISGCTGNRRFVSAYSLCANPEGNSGHKSNDFEDSKPVQRPFPGLRGLPRSSPWIWPPRTSPPEISRCRPPDFSISLPKPM